MIYNTLASNADNMRKRRSGPRFRPTTVACWLDATLASEPLAAWKRLVGAGDPTMSQNSAGQPSGW